MSCEKQALQQRKVFWPRRGEHQDTEQKTEEEKEHRSEITKNFQNYQFSLDNRVVLNMEC